MALNIETFSNVTGGNAFFKAITHPMAAPMFARLARRLAADALVAVYDPHGYLDGVAEFHDLSAIELDGVFVQRVADVGRTIAGRRARPVTELIESRARHLLVASFDPARPLRHIGHLVPDGMTVSSLDDARLPADMMSDRGHYLAPINFATNFAFFRDAGGRHTRLVTANYWAGHGASGVVLWLMLFGGDGEVLAEWRETLGDRARSVVIDSAEIRRRFGLGEFTGQLFIHACGIAGHDVVKYALDTYSDDGAEISCTHDANSWPAEKYAGLPAPRPGERVSLWVQNTHPCPIPAGEIGLNPMGSDDDVVRFGQAIAPFAMAEIDVASLLPGIAWPRQIEIQAGKYFVRPRYEIHGPAKRYRISHVNVERTDLEPDPEIPELARHLGKGYLLPAPILPVDRWRTIALPTPMATCQTELPVALVAYDASAREIAREFLGRLPRDHQCAVDVTAFAARAGGLPSGYGHVELVYDFTDGGVADGWLHALFRYEDIETGHGADTSFGAHVFNTVMTYRGEPQSYIAEPPGLSTRLFLRLGPRPLDTMCHLIYPASTPWHERSATELVLFDGAGDEICRQTVEIPCHGSYLWRYGEAFPDAERDRAGDGAYVLVRDVTCRLFGYHGLVGEGGAFCLDHMFGF
jgi:hypothetical protein